MVWKGPGVLSLKDKKGKPHDFRPEDEIPNDALDALGKDRVKQLQAKGMIGGKRNPGRPAASKE